MATCKPTRALFFFEDTRGTVNSEVINTYACNVDLQLFLVTLYEMSCERLADYIRFFFFLSAPFPSFEIFCLD